MDPALRLHRRMRKAAMRFGAAVTFTKVTHTSEPLTGTVTPSATTVSGYARRVPGVPEQYQALGLIEAEAPTLLFSPNTIGDKPELGATVSLTGETNPFVVRDALPVDMAGSAVQFRVIVSR